VDDGPLVRIIIRACGKPLKIRNQFYIDIDYFCRYSLLYKFFQY